MEAKTKVSEFKSFEVKLSSTISGSIYQEFIEKQKEMEGPDAVGTNWEESEVVDEVLDGKMDKFIFELIKDFEKQTNLIVEGYQEPEIENIPTKVEATENLEIKITLNLQCRLKELAFANTKTIY